MMDLLNIYGIENPGDLLPQPQPVVSRSRRDRQENRPFIRGPVWVDWIARAHEAGGSAVTVGLALWFKQGFFGQTPSVGMKSIEVNVASALRKKFRLTPDQTRRGLKALEAVGLVKYVKGGRGRCAVVKIVDRPEALNARKSESAGKSTD